MRETKTLAATMRTKVNDLKARVAKAQGKLIDEVAASTVAVEKIEAVTNEMAASRADLEATLADLSGSNYQPDETRIYDANGVSTSKA